VPVNTVRALISSKPVLSPLIRDVAGSSIATLLHVAQNEEFVGHGSENGRNEVSSNGGKQLIPRGGVTVDNTQESYDSGRGKLIRKDSSSTTKGTKQTGLSAQSGGGGDMSNLQEYFSALVVLRNIRRSNLRRDDRFQKFAGRTEAKSRGG
jgi:hypothetical protein